MTGIPARGIRIWSDDRGHLRHEAPKGSAADLVGSWLTSDVQGSGRYLVTLLDAIEALRGGRLDEPYEASGNAWQVTITKEHAEIENKYVEHLKGSVQLATVLSVMHSYWNAMGETDVEEGIKSFRKYNRRDPLIPW